MTTTPALVTTDDLRSAEAAYQEAAVVADAALESRNALVRRAAAEGMKQSDIARVLGCHHSRVGQIVHRSGGRG